MVVTDVNFDLTELDRANADLDVRAKRLAPAWRELRGPLRVDQREHDKAQEGPDGPWTPRSPFTEARRKARNKGLRTTKASRTIAIGSISRQRKTPKKILGRLPKAFIVTVGELYIRATSRVPWSGVHQAGGVVGRGSKIPKRTFLWLSSKLLETTEEVIGKFVVKGWDR